CKILTSDEMFVGTIQKLLFWMKDNLLKERPELFMQDDTV
ncbi:unnamed protein product, partial [Heterotrigona itama]